MKATIYTVLIFLILVNNISIAQNFISNPAIDLFEHEPATPNSAGLGKYLDYPVTLSTGTPNISIPLYTVKSGNITIPIVLQYHASGIRVNESASWVGMGWSLEAGGVINKRVNGA